MCNRLTKLSVTMWYTFFGIFDDKSMDSTQNAWSVTMWYTRRVVHHAEIVKSAHVWTQRGNITTYEFPPPKYTPTPFAWESYILLQYSNCSKVVLPLSRLLTQVVALLLWEIAHFHQNIQRSHYIFGYTNKFNFKQWTFPSGYEQNTLVLISQNCHFVNTAFGGAEFSRIWEKYA